MLQMVEGTSLVFAGLFWLYNLASVVAFNACGGFVNPSGYWVISNALLTCTLGLIYKIVLVEPGESNLTAPTVTMTAYLLGMVMTACAGALARRLTPSKGLLSNLGNISSYKNAALGSLVVGATFTFATWNSTEGGTVASAFRQINTFPVLAVVLATFNEVKTSNGRRSWNWIVGTSVSYNLLIGVLSTSKEGLATGPVAWFVTAVICGYDFSQKQIAGVVLGAVFFTSYLAPYSQLARVTRTEDHTIGSDWTNSLLYLEKLGTVRKDYLALEGTTSKDTDSLNAASPHLYDRPQGFLDRLNMIGPDDAIVTNTEEGNVEGLGPIYYSLAGLIPRFLWKDKPSIGMGNVYGREIGMISSEDETTGISFSPTADAYHEAKYWGVFVLLPLVLLVLFLVTDSLSGDIRLSPWGILFAVIFAHTAPEGLLQGQLYVATYKSFGVVLVALVTGYLLPVLTRVLTNQDRTRVDKGVDFKPIQPKPTST